MTPKTPRYPAPARRWLALLLGFLSVPPLAAQDASPRHDADIRYSEAESLFHLQGPKPAIALAERSAQLAEFTLEERDKRIPKALMQLGDFYLQDEVYEKSKQALLRARRLFEADTGSQSVETAVVLRKLAELYFDMHANETALPLLQRARTILEQKDPHGTEFALVLTDIGESFHALGRYTDAENTLGVARQIQAGKKGGGELALARADNNLGLLYEARGRYDKAEPLLVEQLQILASLKDTGPDAIMALGNLGLLYQDTGAADRAIHPLSEAIKPTLSEAQKAMMANPARKHPYYWAAFIPIGNWTPLTM